MMCGIILLVCARTSAHFKGNTDRNQRSQQTKIQPTHSGCKLEAGLNHWFQGAARRVEGKPISAISLQVIRSFIEETPSDFPEKTVFKFA